MKKTSYPFESMLYIQCHKIDDIYVEKTNWFLFSKENNKNIVKAGGMKHEFEFIA